MSETEAIRQQVTTFRAHIDGLRAEIAKSIIGNLSLIHI